MKKRRYLNSGYSEGGANRSKPSLKTYLPSHFSAKSDIELNLGILRDRAADLVVNSPLGSAAVATLTSNVVGSGLKLFPRIKSRELGLSPDETVDWCRRTKQEFSLWADGLNCDYYRRNNFASLQRIAFQSYLTDGDCFCIFRRRAAKFPYTLRLQLIEAGRVSNPQTGLTTLPYNVEVFLGNGNRIINGIEIDKTGQFQAVWVSNRVSNEFLTNGELIEWQRVKIYGDKTGKRNVLQICADTRTEQFRGVPLLAPVIESIKQLARYADAELTSSIIKSFFSIFFTQGAASSGYDLNQILPEDTESAMEQVMQDYKLGAGTITSLPRGVDVKAVDRSNAQDTFEPFVSAFIKMIGAALNLPYEVLLKNFQSSYSASRAAILQAETEFRQRRAMFIEDFLKPVYENFMTEAVALGRIKAEGYFEDELKKSLWLEADWINEGSHLLDVTKELQGAQMRIELGLSNRQMEAAQLCGLDFYDNIEQLKIEEQLLNERADL